MTQFTPFLNLTKPGGGSTGLIVPPDRVDIDVLNDNSNKIDAFALSWGLASARAKTLKGLAAAIPSSGVSFGDTYQETDGSQRMWFYDGSNWISYDDNGLYLIRPTAVSGTGVTQNADGSVDFAAINNAGGMNADGVFTTRFRKFIVDIEVDTVTTAVTSLFLQLRAGGVTLAGASDYKSVRNYNAAGTPSAAQSTSSAVELFPGSATVGTGMRGICKLEFIRPADAACRTFIRGDANAIVSAVSAQGSIGGFYDQVAAVDGFRLVPTSASTPTITGKIKVYGVK